MVTGVFSSWEAAEKKAIRCRSSSRSRATSPPQGLVGGLQVGEGGRQPPGHFVQTAAQLADLVPAPLPAHPLEVQLRHPASDAVQPHDGPGDIPGVPERTQQGEGQQRQSQPGGHPPQGLHRLVGQAELRGDQQLVGPLLVGKGDLGGEDPRLSGGHHTVGPVNLHLIGVGLIGLDRVVRPGHGDGYLPVLLRQDQQGAGVRLRPAGGRQGYLRPALPDKGVQDGPRVGQIGLRQLLGEVGYLGLEPVADHSGVGDGGGPGNQGEGESPCPQQQQEGKQKNTHRQAFSEFPSQHGSPPLSRFQYSPAPACGGGF